MERLHGGEVSVIQHVQSVFSGQQHTLDFMSNVGDIRTAFLVYFPICFYLRRDVGIRMVWAAVLGDWVNLMSKWILFGHRPYWWVHETTFYVNSTVPYLQQFPITCETGPGSPSGHAMGSACVWYVMVKALLDSRAVAARGPATRRWLGAALWSAFAVVQLGVGISRLFVAAHFPHQVLLGALAGMAVADLFGSVSCIHDAPLSRYVGTSAALFALALGFYLALLAVGVDLLWTVAFAKKWCLHPEWVHLDSTPFAGLVRNLGVLAGTGLALNSGLHRDALAGARGEAPAFRAACAIAAVVTLRLYDGVKVPSDDELAFYVLTFCKSLLVPLSALALLPYTLRHLLDAGTRHHKLA
ncbi:glucose-6-phosphatase 2-like [Lethenteron reissneri]|uniref:glucose-6-phosphatase 2-like n=1 Tax=Lethenteron reissneri TaxID=7753 RepID=UPI002AB7E411|nr:glucose-6-phosphatase 2-like [Lethenteron reissneri]